jgi:hypothetical protein
MNAIRKLLGVLLILGGVVLAVWLDLFVFFIGGINKIVDGFNANPNNGHEIAWGFVRAIVFTGLGVVAGVIVVACGAVLLGWRSFRRSSKARSRVLRPSRSGY